MAARVATTIAADEPRPAAGGISESIITLMSLAWNSSRTAETYLRAFRAPDEQTSPVIRSKENPISIRLLAFTSILPGRSSMVTLARRSMADPMAGMPETTACSPNNMTLPGADAVVKRPPLRESHSSVTYDLAIVACDISACCISKELAAGGA